MELFAEIERSGDLHPYYDYAHGFGVPQASYFTREQAKVEPTFSLNTDGHNVSVQVRSDLVEAPPEEFDNLRSAVEFELEKGPYLYYHIENSEGWLSEYFVLEVTQQNVVSFHAMDFPPGSKLRIHYRGYTQTHTF